MELEFPGVGVSMTLKPGGFHDTRTQDACWCDEKVGARAAWCWMQWNSSVRATTASLTRFGYPDVFRRALASMSRRAREGVEIQRHRRSIRRAWPGRCQLAHHGDADHDALKVRRPTQSLRSRRDIRPGRQPREGTAHSRPIAVCSSIAPTPIVSTTQSGRNDDNVHKSAGVRPVFFAIRASMRGPISSLSWKAKTKSGHPARSKTRWEPDWRLMFHPIRKSAANNCRALTDLHWLTARPRRHRPSGARFRHALVGRPELATTMPGLVRSPLAASPRTPEHQARRQLRPAIARHPRVQPRSSTWVTRRC